MKKVLSLLFLTSSIALTGCNALLYKEVSFADFKSAVAEASAKEPKEFTKISFKYSIDTETLKEKGSFALTEDTDPATLTDTQKSVVLIYSLVGSIDDLIYEETPGAKYYTSPNSYKIAIEDESGKGSFEWNEYLYLTNMSSKAEGDTISISASYTY